MTEGELKNELYTQAGLVREDIYDDPRGFKIIKRNGIEKIRTTHGHCHERHNSEWPRHGTDTWTQRLMTRYGTELLSVKPIETE